jgi:integral membrane sensor domain MASE1
VLLFVLEVVGASILVSLFASGIRLIPRYPKRKYFFIQQLANTVLLSIVLTLLLLLKIDLSLPLLCVIILAVLWTSVRFTNRVARDRVT